MSEQTVEATSPNLNRKSEVQYDFGESLAEACDLFGEEVVFARYKAMTVIDLQGYIRGLHKQEKTDEEIQDLVSEWKPGIKARGKSPEEKLADLLAKIPAHEREEALRRAYSRATDDGQDEA